MRNRIRMTGLMAVALALLLVGSLGDRATAASCRNSGHFESWLAQFRQEALAQGISQHAITAAAPYMTYDQRIVNIDRGQRIFQQSFLEFSDHMLAGYRLTRGAALIKRDRKSVV